VGCCIYFRIIDFFFIDSQEAQNDDKKFKQMLLKILHGTIITVIMFAVGFWVLYIGGLAYIPSALAKDIAQYKVEHMQPVDMFPQTAHVEVISKLILK
jgi:hypothetical protein